MSKEKEIIETTTAEELVEVTDKKEKKAVIMQWMKDHPVKTTIGILTGTIVFVLAGYGIYKLIDGKLYKVVSEEPTEDDFEDKTEETV